MMKREITFKPNSRKLRPITNNSLLFGPSGLKCSPPVQEVHQIRNNEQNSYKGRNLYKGIYFSYKGTNFVLRDKFRTKGQISYKGTNFVQRDIFLQRNIFVQRDISCVKQKFGPSSLSRLVRDPKMFINLKINKVKVPAKFGQDWPRGLGKKEGPGTTGFVDL